MADWEKTIVPLDQANEMLAIFGIGPNDKEYWRWRRVDGFRHVDFEGVLNRSKFVVGFDWKTPLDEALELILTRLDAVGLTAHTILDDEGDQGVIVIDGNQESIKYVSTDGDDYDYVIQSINRLIHEMALFRKFRSCIESDGWFFALLRNEDWSFLAATVPDLFRLLFVTASWDQFSSKIWHPWQDVATKA